MISNSVLRWNIEDWELSGAGNVARLNCVWTTRTDSYGRQGGVKVDPDFTATQNLVADPGFVNRTAKDFTPRRGQPVCGAAGGGRNATAGRRVRSQGHNPDPSRVPNPAAARPGPEPGPRAGGRGRSAGRWR